MLFFVYVVKRGFICALDGMGVRPHPPLRYVPTTFGFAEVDPKGKARMSPYILLVSSLNAVNLTFFKIKTNKLEFL